MTKLINKFNSDRNVANARKLADYATAHPMALCFLSEQDAALLALARTVAFGPEG